MIEIMVERRLADLEDLFKIIRSENCFRDLPTVREELLLGFCASTETNGGSFSRVTPLPLLFLLLLLPSRVRDSENCYRLSTCHTFE